MKKAVLILLILTAFAYLVITKFQDMSKINYAEIIGKQFGYYTVIEPIPSSNKKITCQCVCGNIRVCTLHDLNRGKTKSCGCQQANLVRDSKIRHGMSYHPLQSVYTNMMARCNNPKSKCYSYYGGRGINVCDEWMNSNEVFFSWAIDSGWKKGLKLDRKDNEKGYSPDNCRFVTHTVNMRNTRANRLFEYRGEKRTLGEWVEVLGLSDGAVRARIYGKGLSIEEAFNRPVRRKKRRGVTEV